MEKRVRGLVLALFAVATPLPADADFSLYFLSPTSNGTAGPIQILASATSTFEVVSVTAHLNGADIPLAYGCLSFLGCGWGALVDDPTLAPGMIPLSATAVDVFGNIAQTQTQFSYRPPPRLVVASPIPGAVATPFVRVQADCEDAGGGPCQWIKVWARGQVLATATTSIDQDVDVSGGTEGFHIEAAGASSTRASVGRQVYLVVSPDLDLVESVPGVILDADAQRVLFRADDPPTLSLRDRGAQLDTPIFTPAADSSVALGFVTPHGALFSLNEGSSQEDCSSYSCLFEWRDAQLLDHGALSSSSSLSVAGGWAIWHDVSNSLREYDIEAGADVLVSSAAANSEQSVSPNGDVAYWTTDYRIERYRGGQTDPISDGTGNDVYPLTDGTNIVYRRGLVSDGEYQLILHTDNGEEVLADPAVESGSTAGPQPGSDYRLAGGWVAFTRPGPSGQSQIWLRSPVGAITRETFYETSSRIASLGAQGDLVFTGPTTAAFLLPGDAPYGSLGIDLTDGGATGGTYFYIGDALHMRIGTSLFRVNSLDDPDGDAVPKYADNCEDDFNPEQMDADQDGVGEPCGCEWVGPEVTDCDVVSGAPPTWSAITNTTLYASSNLWVRNLGCEERGSCATPGAAKEVHVFLGGSIGGWLVAQDSSLVRVSGGIVHGSLAALGSGTAELRAGSVDGGLVARDGATISWAGGSLGGALVAYDAALIEVVGADFEVDGTPVALGDLAESVASGVLTGRLASGESFSVSFYQGSWDEDVTGTIRLVPEPGAALASIAAGAALVAVRKSRTRPTSSTLE